MAPPRAMTGDTFTDEKTPQSPVSPTDTEATLAGDAIHGSIDASRSLPQPPSLSYSHDVENAQPRR